MGDHPEIMFDHQDRSAGGNPLDQRGDPLDVLMTHTGSRFIGDFQGAFSPIRQFNRFPMCE
jgi:hypothetical protein